jgi:hypothetical protein
MPSSRSPRTHWTGLYGYTATDALSSPFADQGTSVVVRIDADQAQRLSASIAPAQLVPVKDWHRRPDEDRA